MIKEYFFLLLKGVGMGAANIIPGVSGGTIALITGIFERLIDAIKSFNLKAIKLLFTFKLKEFVKHTDFWFLLAIFAGVGISIKTLVELLSYLFTNFPVYVWSFFFGLILASVYFVGKTITKWNYATILFFIVGTGAAISITFLSPATENTSSWYLFICGIIAVCSMILPGLSGSFVLILLGNYKLVMIDSIDELNWKILVPVAAGAAFGLIAFSHLLSWVYKRFKNQTIALLTGFILGSLGFLWPWKYELTETFGEKTKVVGYDWQLPDSFSREVIIACMLVIIGIVSIWLIEKFATRQNQK